MTILNLCVSLVFVFLVFAVVVSGIQEWWAQYRGMRGKWLRLGMMRLIDDNDLFVRVLQHPLVGSLYQDRAARGKPPSYVEPSNFALALAAVMLRRASLLTPPSNPEMPASNGQGVADGLTFQSLRKAAQVLAAQKSSAADSVLPILDSANEDLGTALKGLETWFSSGMDRVTGWYKGAAQRRLFVIGFIAAAIGNVDAIAIFQALDREPTLAAQIADNASTVVDSGRLGPLDAEHLQRGDIAPEQAQAVLKWALALPVGKLPLGYGCLAASSEPTANGTMVRSAISACTAELMTRARTWPPSEWFLHALGWLLTAFAGTLGAPYWFSMLSKITGIRGSGPKPVERK
jgi:hypothetical protein